MYPVLLHRDGARAITYGGAHKDPPIHRPIGGWGVDCRATGITLSSFHTHLLTLSMVPATHTCSVGVSMTVEWVQGAPLHSHTQLHMQYGTRVFMWQRVRIALYNRLFARSIITCRRGVGGEIHPWGKGLTNVHLAVDWKVFK